MSKSRAKCLLEKSVAAMVSAVEIYNKPDFRYREETFAVLAVNAWELLFKAQILQERSNHMQYLYVYEKRVTKRGISSKKGYVKLNRSGNPVTIGISKAMTIIENDLGIPLNIKLKDNIAGLLEIRDNSVHFLNSDVQLSKRIQEIGTATLRNYVSLTKQWFAYDLSNLNFYLMPLSFFHEAPSSTVIVLNHQEQKVLEYLLDLQKAEGLDQNPDFSIASNLEIKVIRARTDDAIKVQVTNDPSAPTVQLIDEDFRKSHPWTYKRLTEELRKRYRDFIVNSKFYEIRKPLLKESKYARERRLDIENPKSPRMVFYNPNILTEFDKHYLKNESRAHPHQGH